MDKVKIKLHENQKIFFTSDLHFQHKNVIRFCRRPFENIKDMELKLIENWNSVVSNEDIVFDLGDVLWFDGRHDAKRILNQLNGIHYVILGNHDNKNNFELCDKVIVCETCTQVFIQTLDNKTQEIMLSHFPLLTWPHIDHNVINLFGHIHCRQMVKRFGLDVGVDCHYFKPISIKDVLFYKTAIEKYYDNNVFM